MHVHRIRCDGCQVTSVGDFVVDVTAKRADDTGSDIGMGVRGIVVAVHPDWVDQESGEKADLCVVATRHHGQLRFEDVMASDVAESWPCGRIDAGGYIGVCQREIAKAKRGNVDPRVVELLTLVTRIKESPASPYIGGQQPAGESILERADRERAADPEAQAAYERMTEAINAKRAARGAPPITKEHV